MRQNELHRAIAQATGESLDTIRRLGFCLTKIPEPENTSTHRDNSQKVAGKSPQPAIPSLSAERGVS